MSDLTTLAAALDAEVERLSELARQVRRLAAMDDPENSGGEADRLLKADEAAVLLGVSKPRMWELGRKGQAGVVRLGKRQMRFSLRGLNKWVAEGGEARHGTDRL